MGSAEDPGRRQEIQSILKSIVETSDRWLERLKKRQWRVRVATSFLTTIFVFAAVGIALLAYLVIRNGLDYVTSLFLQSGQAYEVLGAAGIAGLASGFATYFVIRRRHNAQLKELSSLIVEMKTEGEQSKKMNGESAGGITGHALYLAEKMVTLLPDLVRQRNRDSVLFGIVAFVLGLTFGGNLGVAFLAGIIVWLYFRYENKKTYEEEISKFEEQKRVFEQRKKDFMESL